MNGRRIYHARGKVLGGSSSHQRDDLPARQPARLRALGRRPGHGDLGLRPLPAVLQADGGLPRRGRRRPVPRARRPADARARAGDQPAVRGLLRRDGARPGYPRTDDVNGYRQEGFAEVRPQHQPRPPAVGGAGLPAPGDGPAEPDRQDPGLRRRGRLRGQPGGRRALPRTGAGRPRSRAAGEVILCGGAINTPQLLQLSGVGNARELVARSASRSCTTCPASARTCRTTSRSTSSTPARSRCRCRSTCRCATGRWIGAQWLFLRKRPGRDQPLRGRRLRPQQRRRRLPEPDVPLPADRGPVRRVRRRPAATATRCTSGRCTPTPAAR